MKKTIIIRKHSIVDLITNSSTEVFIEASEETIVILKKFINSLLKTFNVDKTADDLFEFHLTNINAFEEFIEDYFCDYCDKYDKEKCKDINCIECDHAKENCTEKIWADEYRSEESDPLSDVIVTTKDESCKEAADILSALSNTFKAKAYYI